MNVVKLVYLEEGDKNYCNFIKIKFANLVPRVFSWGSPFFWRVVNIFLVLMDSGF